MTYPADMFAAQFTVRIAFEAPGRLPAFCDAMEMRRLLETAIGSILNTSMSGRLRTDPLSPDGSEYTVRVGDLEEYDDLGRRIFTPDPSQADLDVFQCDDDEDDELLRWVARPSHQLFDS